MSEKLAYRLVDRRDDAVLGTFSFVPDYRRGPRCQIKFLPPLDFTKVRVGEPVPVTEAYEVVSVLINHEDRIVWVDNDRDRDKLQTHFAFRKEVA